MKISGIYYFLAVGILLSAVFCSRPEQNQIHLSGKVMGTTWNAVIEKALTKKEVESVKKQIQAELDRIDSLMSTWKDNSELSRFNHHHSLEAFRISDDTSKVIQESIRINGLTQGAFDPGIGPLIDLWGFGKNHTEIIPDDKILQKTKSYSGIKLLVFKDKEIRKKNPKLELNLSGIAKGYAVDRVQEVMSKNSISSYMIEVGGEIRTGNPPSDKQFWSIGVEKPDYEFRQILEQTMKLKNISVATSGDYRNFFRKKSIIYTHILDPATGIPVKRQIASATVIGPECMTADALATSMLVLGEDRGLEIMKHFPDYEVYLLIKNKDSNSFRTAMSPGMKKYILNN